MKKEEIYHKLLIIFISIYPLFNLKIFYNSYFTLIQILAIFTFLIGLIIIKKESRKGIKYLVLYYLILIIYGVFHHLNALNFTSLIPGNFNYELIKEILALIKMSMPIPFVFIIYYAKLNSKDLLKIVKSWLILICGSIIITNIFKVSLSSYSNTPIKGSIFSWFTKEYIYKETASKGFFMYANGISCILVCLIPLAMSYYYKNNLNSKYLLILIITLLMLGTRISNIAGLMVYITLIMSYLFITIITKNKLNKSKFFSSIILGIIYLSILPFSPTFSRYEVYDYLKAPNLIATLAETNMENIKYIENNYQDLQINEHFITKSYPYEYDPAFWLKILREPIKNRTDYRYLEIAMVKRVKKINNNKLDNFLGITNTRIQNIFNIERGYILEYYAYGIIGSIILLGIYILILLNNIYHFLKKFNYDNICYCASITLFLIISYLSGNIFASLPTIIILLVTIFNRKNIDNIRHI